MAPMHVLQASPFIIGYRYAQVLLVQFVPTGWNIFGTNDAADEFLFYFISNHHVKVVSEFIRFSSNEGGLYFVDGSVKIFYINSPKLLRKLLLDVLIVTFPKRQTSSNTIFP